MAQPATDWDSYFGSAAPANSSAAPAVTGAAVGATAPPSNPTAALGSASDQWDSWLREPALLGSSIVKGAAAIPRIPEMLSNAFFRGMDALTGSNVAPTLEKANTVSTAITNAPLAATNALGITDNPHLAPQGVGETLLAGAGTALPYAAADVLSGGSTTPALINAGLSGAAAEGAHMMAPDSTLAPILAGALTGHIAGRATSAIQTLKTIKQAQATADDAAEQLALLNKNSPTTRKGIDDVVAAGKASADASHQATMLDIAQNHDSTLLGHQTVLDNTAAKLGNSETFEDAGRQLQPAVRTWVNEALPDKLAAAWKPLDDALPAETPTPSTNFSEAVNSINKKAGVMQPIVDSMTPSLAKTFKTKLDAVAEKADLTGEVPPVPTWSDMAATRTALGEALSNPKLIDNLGVKNAKTLYGALTTDMRAAAAKTDLANVDAIGNGSAPSTVNLFDAANTESQRLFDLAGGPMAKVVKGTVESSADAPGATASRLLAEAQKDGTTLAALRAEVPDAVDHLGAVAIRTGQWPKLADSAKQALVPDASQRAAVEQALQGKAMTIEETKTAVANAKAQHQEQLDALAAVAKQKKFELAQQKADLGYTAAQAKATASKLKASPPGNALTHGVGAIVGGEFGGELGTVLGDTMGLPGSDLYHGAVGKIAGLTIPWTVRRGMGMISSLYRNPAVRKSTAIGAAIGSADAPNTSPGSGNALGAQQQ